MLGKIPILTSIFFKFRWFHHQPEKKSPRFSASRCFNTAVGMCRRQKPVSARFMKNKKKQASATKDGFSRCFFVLLQRRAAYFRDEETKGKAELFCAGCFCIGRRWVCHHFFKMVNFQTWKMLPTPIQIMVKLGVPKLYKNGGFNPGLPGSFFVNHL